MYYRKHIPLPFQQVPQAGPPAAPEESPAVSIATEEKKPPLQKSVDASPLAAVLLLQILRQK